VVIILSALKVVVKDEFKLEDKEVYVQVGESYTINYTLNGLSQDQLAFASLDENIATVDPKGVVKGIKEGQAIVTINFKNKVEKVKVIVLSNSENSQPVTIGATKEYECSSGRTLKGNKCYLYQEKTDGKCDEYFDETTDGKCVQKTNASYKYTCPSGYSLTDENKCTKE
jgi:hypothetical protein